jgi:DCN1-like protein 1/2
MRDDLEFALVSIRVKDARKFLEKHKRVDYAIDAYYNDPAALAATARRQADTSAPSTSKLNTLFDKYKGAFACSERVSSMLSLAQSIQCRSK